MRESALGVLRRGDEVLLAQRAAGANIGTWVPYGGKLQRNESPQAALVREVGEESSLVIREKDAALSASILTFLDGVPQFLLHVFSVWRWSGTPHDSDEMRNPRFFRTAALPLHNMWECDRLWLPQLLSGEPFPTVLRFSTPETRKNAFIPVFATMPASP